MNKKILLGGAGVLVVGGGVAAYTLLNKTDKEAYFHAEMNTLTETAEFFEERYAPEFKWVETQLEKPTEVNFNLSVDMGSEDFYAAMLQNASLDVTVLSDPAKNETALKLGAAAFGFEVDNVGVYLTKDALIAEVPFQEEALELDFKTLDSFIEMTTGENLCLENFDFQNSLTAPLMTEKDLEYITSTYGKEMVAQLPDEAFTKEKDQITMKLTGAQIKTALVSVLETAKDDKKVVKIITDLILATDACQDLDVKEEMDSIIAMIKEQTFEFDLTSKIWVKDNIIVKRELTIDELTIIATQSIGKKFTFNYTAAVESQELTLAGSFGSGKSYDDEASITVDGREVITYDAQEALAKNTRKYERTLTLADEYSGDSVVTWIGESTSDKNASTDSSEISVASPYIGEITLNIESSGKTIKKIDTPTNTINLSNMSEDELYDYLGNEFAENFYIWVEENFGGLESLFY